MHLNSTQIAQILPQSYPFLMIDRVVDFKKGESLTAIKNITGNEWFFEGQSCQAGAFPETLLIEAAAQAAILFSFAEYLEDCFEDGGERSSCEAKHDKYLAKQSRLRRNEPIQSFSEILRNLLWRGSFYRAEKL